MKISRLFAGVLMAGMLLSSASFAATVDIPGILSNGDSHTYHSNSMGSGKVTYDYIVKGVLSAKTQIVLTLTVELNKYATIISDSVKTRFGTDSGSTGYNRHIAELKMFFTAFTPSAFQTNGNTLTTSLTIANTSSTYLAFAGEINAMIELIKRCGGKGLITLSYNVTSTPLPASLLLFASGLTALGGFAARKRTRE